MKIYDISQEVFSSCTYPGDPVPQKDEILRLQKGDVCNLSAFSMCAHNGTHIDAPFHFLEEGLQVHQLRPESFVGECYVSEWEGTLTDKEALILLNRAKDASPDAAKRILIKGRAVVSASAAKVFAQSGVLLVGNESQTVGEVNAPREVHLILLKQNVVLLEGIRLARVPEGIYFLCAAPLNLAGFDGAPCRAILVSPNQEREE